MNPRLINAMELICRRLYNLNEDNTEMQTCNIKTNSVEAVFNSDLAVLKVTVPRGIVEDYANQQEDLQDHIRQNYDVQEEALEEEVEDGNEETNKEDNEEKSKKPPRRRS